MKSFRIKSRRRHRITKNHKKSNKRCTRRRVYKMRGG